MKGGREGERERELEEGREGGMRRGSEKRLKNDRHDSQKREEQDQQYKEVDTKIERCIEGNVENELKRRKGAEEDERARNKTSRYEKGGTGDHEQINHSEREAIREDTNKDRANTEKNGSQGGNKSVKNGLQE
jgi:hypothetical protein